MQHRAVVLLMLACAAPLAAQQARRQVTAEDYARAERRLNYHTNTLVLNGPVRPTWLAGDRFWYRNLVAGGAEFVLVDPARRSKARAFDHERIAAALSRAADTTYQPLALPFTQFAFSADGRSLVFDVRNRRYTCVLDGSGCTAAAVPRRDPGLQNATISPDSTRAAFIRDYNLWVRELATGRETQLTSDGVRDFGYGTDNAGWVRSERTIVTWSPDSRMLATYQQDERRVGEMFLVNATRGPRPTLEQWRYPLAGDSVIQMIHRVVIHLDGPRVVRLQTPPDAHRSSVCDHIVCGGRWADVEWSADGSQLIFLSTARDHRQHWLRVADPQTGSVREVFNETDRYFLESGYNRQNWRPLNATGELLWYSERSDWGHLYLYDLRSGQLKNAVTSGEWKVLQVLRTDEPRRTVYFTAAGREGGDPYFRRFYSVRLDGTRLTNLTPEDADHDVSLAPSGNYFVDNHSRPERPSVSVLRDAAGRLVLELERADISRLVATGWQPPIPITVKARDGRTDLYGLMYRPANFDSTQRYPVVNRIYPGPQSGSVGSRSFVASRSDNQALAELGFVVVEIDAMGTPMRSHSFQAAYYGNMGDNGLPDQVAGMQELGRRHAWIDLDRVGIWGHSGGGYAAAGAILRYPDFFDVAVSQAGNHDQRQYEDDWGEKWHGLLERSGSGTNYDDQANQTHAANLRGKLLIAHGSADNNVPPYATMLLVNELIRNNKDFDLLLMPDRRHGFGNEPYMIRRRWDYFVRHLLNQEPPQYQLRPPGTPGARPAS